MTTFTPSQLRRMADDYDLSAADYGFDVRISNALRQASEDAERLEVLSTFGKHYGSDGTYRWLLVADQKRDMRDALDSIIATRTPKEQTK